MLAEEAELLAQQRQAEPRGHRPRAQSRRLPPHRQAARRGVLQGEGGRGLSRRHKGQALFFRYCPDKIDILPGDGGFVRVLETFFLFFVLNAITLFSI